MNSDLGFLVNFYIFRNSQTERLCTSPRTLDQKITQAKKVRQVLGAIDEELSEDSVASPSPHLEMGT
jgi:hypothetical protein